MGKHAHTRWRLGPQRPAPAQRSTDPAAAIAAARSLAEEMRLTAASWEHFADVMEAGDTAAAVTSARLAYMAVRHMESAVRAHAAKLNGGR